MSETEGLWNAQPQIPRPLTPLVTARAATWQARSLRSHAPPQHPRPETSCPRHGWQLIPSLKTAGGESRTPRFLGPTLMAMGAGPGEASPCSLVIPLTISLGHFWALLRVPNFEGPFCQWGERGR